MENEKKEYITVWYGPVYETYLKVDGSNVGKVQLVEGTSAEATALVPDDREHTHLFWDICELMYPAPNFYLEPGETLLFTDKDEVFILAREIAGIKAARANGLKKPPYNEREKERCDRVLDVLGLCIDRMSGEEEGERLALQIGRREL